MELNVKWGNHSYRGEAKKVYLEIESIGDDVKPQQIVDYAKDNPGSELHKCFTWDNNIAADKWRLQEARNIVCNLVVNYAKADNKDFVPQKVDVRMMHRCSTDIDAGYKSLPKILVNKDLHAGLLAEAKSYLNRFKEKFAILSEVNEMKPIFMAIDELQ